MPSRKSHTILSVWLPHFKSKHSKSEINTTYCSMGLSDLLPGDYKAFHIMRGRGGYKEQAQRVEIICAGLVSCSAGSTAHSEIQAQPRGRDLGKAASVSGGSEFTGQSSNRAELTNPSLEATLPPAKPNHVWSHGLKHVSARKTAKLKLISTPSSREKTLSPRLESVRAHLKA